MLKTNKGSGLISLLTGALVGTVVFFGAVENRSGDGDGLAVYGVAFVVACAAGAATCWGVGIIGRFFRVSDSGIARFFRRRDAPCETVEGDKSPKSPGTVFYMVVGGAVYVAREAFFPDSSRWWVVPIGAAACVVAGLLFYRK